MTMFMTVFPVIIIIITMITKPVPLTGGAEACSDWCCLSGSTSSCDGKLKKLKTEYFSRLTIDKPTIDELKSTAAIRTYFYKKMTMQYNWLSLVLEEMQNY